MRALEVVFTWIFDRMREQYAAALLRLLLQRLKRKGVIKTCFVMVRDPDGVYRPFSISENYEHRKETERESRGEAGHQEQGDNS